MRFFCLAALLASACAFTSQPAAFTTHSPVVGERAIDNVVVAPSSSHRNRRATIVMDGKANGELHCRFHSTGDTRASDAWSLETFEKFENGMLLPKYPKRWIHDCSILNLE
jgi:hypothetical protein